MLEGDGMDFKKNATIETGKVPEIDLSEPRYSFTPSNVKLPLPPVKPPTSEESSSIDFAEFFEKNSLENPSFEEDKSYPTKQNNNLIGQSDIESNSAEDASSTSSQDSSVDSFFASFSPQMKRDTASKGAIRPNRSTPNGLPSYGTDIGGGNSNGTSGMNISDSSVDYHSDSVAPREVDLDVANPLLLNKGPLSTDFLESPQAVLQRAMQETEIKKRLRRIGLTEKDINRVVHKEITFEDLMNEILADCDNEIYDRYQRILECSLIQNKYYFNEEEFRGQMELYLQEIQELQRLDLESDDNMMVNYDKTTKHILDHASWSETKKMYVSTTIDGIEVTFTEEEFTFLQTSYEENHQALVNEQKAKDDRIQFLQNQIDLLKEKLSDPTREEFTYTTMDEIDLEIHKWDQSIYNILNPYLEGQFGNNLALVLKEMRYNHKTYEEASQLLIGYIDIETGDFYCYNENEENRTVDESKLLPLRFGDVYQNRWQVQVILDKSLVDENGMHTWNDDTKEYTEYLSYLITTNLADYSQDKERVSQELLSILSQRNKIVAIKDDILATIYLSQTQDFLNSDFYYKNQYDSESALEALALTDENVEAHSNVFSTVYFFNSKTEVTHEMLGAMMAAVMNGDVTFGEDDTGGFTTFKLGYQGKEIYYQDNSFSYINILNDIKPLKYNWIKQLNKYEKEEFLYICNTQGYESGFDYIMNIAKLLDQRSTNARTKNVAADVRENGLLAGLKGVWYFFTTPIYALGSLSKVLTTKLLGGELYLSDIYNPGQIAHQVMSSDLNTNYGSFWSNVFDIIYSMDQSMMNLALAKTGIGPIASSFLTFGSPVFNQSLYHAKSRGIGDNAAITEAFLHSIIETGMESYSLSHLMNLEKSFQKALSSGGVVSKIHNKISKLPAKYQPFAEKVFAFIYSGASQGFVGGEEEWSTEHLDNLATFVCERTDSEAYQSYEFYKKTHPDCSELEAIAFVLNGIGQDANAAWLPGFIAEFLMGASMNINYNGTFQILDEQEINRRQQDFQNYKRTPEGIMKIYNVSLPVALVMLQTGASVEVATCAVKHNVSVDVVQNMLKENQASLPVVDTMLEHHVSSDVAKCMVKHHVSSDVAQYMLEHNISSGLASLLKTPEFQTENEQQLIELDHFIDAYIKDSSTPLPSGLSNDVLDVLTQFLENPWNEPFPRLPHAFELFFNVKANELTKVYPELYQEAVMRERANIEEMIQNGDDLHYLLKIYKNSLSVQNSRAFVDAFLGYVGDLLFNYENNPNYFQDVTYNDIAMLWSIIDDLEYYQFGNPEALSQYKERVYTIQSQYSLLYQEYVLNHPAEYSQLFDAAKEDALSVLSSYSSLGGFMKNYFDRHITSFNNIQIEAYVSVIMDQLSSFPSSQVDIGFDDFANFLEKLDHSVLYLSADYYKNCRRRVQELQIQYYDSAVRSMNTAFQKFGMTVSLINGKFMVSGLKPNSTYNLSVAFDYYDIIDYSPVFVIHADSDGNANISELSMESLSKHYSHIINSALNGSFDVKKLSLIHEFSTDERDTSINHLANNPNYNALVGEGEMVGVNQSILTYITNPFKSLNSKSSELIHSLYAKALKGLIVPHEEVASKTFDIVRSYLPNLSDSDIVRFLVKVDSKGACSHAAVCNMIALQFQKKLDTFRKLFGYDLYRVDEKGHRVLNSEYLLADLYSFLNRDNEHFFSKKVDSNGVEHTTYLNPFKHDGQVYAGNIDLIQAFFDYKAQQNHFDQSIKVDEELYPLAIATPESLYQTVSQGLQNGISYKLGIHANYNQGEQLIMYEYNPETGLHDKVVGTDKWFSNSSVYDDNGAFQNHIFGHDTTILDVTPQGFYVQSWGKTYYITFNALSKVNADVTSFSVHIE